MMTTARLPGVLAVAVLASLSTAFLGAAYFARRVVVPTTARREDLAIQKVFAAGDGTLRIQLPKTPLTTAPGRYSLWFSNGKGHACIGAIVDQDQTSGTVTRAVERVDAGDLHSAAAGIWSGYAYSKPDQLDLSFEQVDIPVDGGSAPAWKFEPASKASTGTWAIHAHGMGGKRAGALRGVPVAGRLGFTSLVVSYRNDGEAPPSNDSRYSLGQYEWLDLEAAIRFAMDHGAARIVLFGWSLGASMALRAAGQSAHADRIAALVLVAPVLDWTQTLTTNGRASRLPKLVIKLGLHVLSGNVGRWVAGLEHPIDFSTLNWMARAGELATPTLILHGTADRSTPFEVSEQFAKSRPDLVQLVSFDVPGHSLEWNGDPEKWEASVVEFLRSKIGNWNLAYSS